MKGRWSAVMALCIAASDWASLAATRPDEPRPPINLKVDPLIEPVIDSMWHTSPTFRRQCRRLASEPGLNVTVAREDEPIKSAFANARTALTFDGNELVAAHIFLKTAVNGPELIAHELEHILEQLDGVDLQAQAGNGAVWKSERASYETRRAIETGRRVAREIADGTKAKRDAATATSPTVTVKLADHDATPVSARTARVSADGRSVVFISSAALSGDDRNSLRDVYVMDLATRRISLVSLGPTGESANGDALQADISGNGRYVVFASEAGNLLTTSFRAGCAQIFLYDRENKTTRLLTATVEGRPANGRSGNPVISANGSLIAFESAATDLVTDGGDRQNATVGIYLIRLAIGERKRVDIAKGASSPGSSMSPAISADGRYVVFASRADLACGNDCQQAPDGPPRNRRSDIYIYDTDSDTTRRLSHGPAESAANGPSYDPAISGDGRFVAFVSAASNLTPDSSGGSPQIYLHDLALGTTARVSRSVSGHPANGNSLRPALSFDGSILVFQSLATNLVCERKCPAALDDTNLLWDVFACDTRVGRTVRLSADVGEEWMEQSRGPSIDDAGRIVAFGSRHPIDETDAQNDEDLYLVRIEPARSVSARRF